jgi:anti-anti-sigma regulatory factor
VLATLDSASDHRVVLDFSDVTFLDSSGIKVLVTTSRRLGTSNLSRNASEQIVGTLKICDSPICSSNRR